MAKDGDFIGMDIELAGELARTMGVKLQLVPTSWPTLMKDFGDDRFDLAIGGVSVTLEPRPGTRRCSRSTSPVRLVVNPGGTNERFAKAQAPQAQLTVHADNVTIFDEIVAGRADLMITDAIEAKLQQRLKPQLCAVHPDAPFDFSEKAILMQRDWLFKAYVDQWLHQAIASGALQKSLDRWLDYRW